jgi:cytochrome c oxidase subunit 2
VRRKPLVALVLGAAAALTIAGAAAAADGGLGPVDPADPGAERIQDIYWVLLGIAAFIVLIVFVPLLVFIVRYRANGRARTVDGPQVRGNTQLELGWTLGATLLIVGLAVVVFYKLPGIVDPAQAGSEELSVRVEGRQFYWQYEYPNGVIAIDTLRLPLGREVEFAVSAPEGDVIHSFWVPALAGKRDAIPGQETTFKVVPSTTGRFQVICGEFCGLQHAVMRGAVEVVEADEFDAWLDEQEQAQEAGESDLGEQIWNGVCSKCHGPDVAGEVGPPLEGNALLADAEAIEELVRNGRGEMPAVGQGWSDEQVEALTDFLEEEIAPAENGEGDDGDES